MLEDFGFAADAAAFGDRPMRSGTRDRGMWTPQVETFRRGDKLVVRADLPGLSKDDIKVELDDNALVISGERSDEHEDNREGYYVTERSYGQFYRAVPLPEGVSGDQCEATFKDGVLEVTLKAPKGGTESEADRNQIAQHDAVRRRTRPARLLRQRSSRPNSRRSSVLARSSTRRCDALRLSPARLM